MDTDRSRPLALAYCRVSTEQQVEHGASLDAQRDALRAEADRRGWRMEVVVDEGLSGKSMDRPGLQGALARLDARRAHALMAVRIDRVSRSVADFAALMIRARQRRWSLVMLSPAIDLEDPTSRLLTHVLIATAEYERELISIRVREGMARRRVEGVHLGRPTVLPREVITSIVAARRAGMSLRAIATDLDALDIPTAHGAERWHHTTVAAVLASSAGRAALKELKQS